MVKTDGVKQKAQTHFEQVSLDVVEKVLGRDALRRVTRESEAGGPSVTENERLGRPRGFNADR